ncbi:MAG: glycerol-3-phosphate responsive antiterminator [Pseudoflavonifractor sp.]
MQLKPFLEALYDGPVIASVKDDEGLADALLSQCRVIFLLYGNVITIADLVARVKDAGKLVLVHLDLVDGLALRDISVEFIARHTLADGIITTKPQLARRAKALGLIALQRFFLLDSLALQNVHKQLEQDCCDLIEVLPGIMPKVIRALAATTGKPIIAGGLIADKEDVTSALSAGAIAVSSTNREIWFL